MSVIIAAYNSEATLPEQLDALAQQTYTGEWELLVADNGSTDATRRVVADSATRIGNVRVVDASARRGTSFARNRGASEANGDVLLFCDDDDVVAPNWIDELLGSANGADLVGGKRDLVMLNSAETRYWRGVDEAFNARFGQPPHAVGSNMLIRRQLFDELGGFDEEFLGGGEDVDLGIRVGAAGGAMAFDDAALIHYRLKTTPRAVGRQAFNYGRSDPHLFRKHRARGYRRRPTSLVLKSWGWIVLNCWRLLSRRERGRWLWVAGKNAGRVAGSFRQGVVYL